MKSPNFLRPDFLPIPASRNSRADWSDNLESMAHNLALYGNTPLPLGYQVCPSDASKFFSGKAFSTWKKVSESDGKVQSAIIGRLNDVIRSIGIIAKVLSKRR